LGAWQGLHGSGFKVTVVGHSLGAGAAALLALMLSDKCAQPPALLSSCTPSSPVFHLAEPAYIPL
jgi:acetyl esterase/lipase